MQDLDRKIDVIDVSPNSHSAFIPFSTLPGVVTTATLPGVSTTITNTATATTSLFFTTTLPGATVVQTLPGVVTTITASGKTVEDSVVRTTVRTRMIGPCAG